MAIYKNENGKLVRYTSSYVVDNALSSTSKNPVKNKVVTAAINEVNAKLDAYATTEYVDQKIGEINAILESIIG